VAWAQAENISVDATYLTGDPNLLDLPTPLDQQRWHHCDILDVDRLAAVVNAVGPTAVINAAYRQGGEYATEICSTGATNVAMAAEQGSARVVHISTDLVFDGELGRAYREDDATSPISDYGRAKSRAESSVKAANSNSVIVRTSLIYGHPDAPQERLVQRAADTGDISFFTDEWRSPVHVDHLADAVGRLAVDASFTGILHLAGNERVNRLEFARLLAGPLGLDPRLLNGSPADPSLGPRSSDVTLDTTTAAGMGFDMAGATTVLTTRT